MEHQSTNTTDNRQLSRRSVVRTAAHAAWAVPAIQVAATVPAYAAVSDPLTFTAGSGDWTQPLGYPYVDVTTTVLNGSATDTTANLQITVQFPNMYVWSPLLGANQTITISNVTGGWSAGTVTYSGTGTGRTATVVFTATAQLAASASKTLTFRATTTRILVDPAGADSLTLTATATNHVTGSTTINPTA